ncbi:MAG TPA: type IV pilin protein [Vicinamibacterales bacterium]
MQSYRVRGFTLIELMIVVAVIAVLAIIAVSSYGEQIRKSRRAEAARFVGEIQLKLEQWRAENPCYGVSNVGGCPVFTASGTYPTLPTSAVSKYYTIAIPTATATAYSVTATPAGAQVGDRCGVLTGTQTGKPTWANAACN